jgi:hypothetical protein
LEVASCIRLGPPSGASGQAFAAYQSRDGSLDEIKATFHVKSVNGLKASGDWIVRPIKEKSFGALSTSA